MKPNDLTSLDYMLQLIAGEISIWLEVKFAHGRATIDLIARSEAVRRASLVETALYNRLGSVFIECHQKSFFFVVLRCFWHEYKSI